MRTTYRVEFREIDKFERLFVNIKLSPEEAKVIQELNRKLFAFSKYSMNIYKGGDWNWIRN